MNSKQEHVGAGGCLLPSHCLGKVTSAIGALAALDGASSNPIAVSQPHPSPSGDSPAFNAFSKGGREKNKLENKFMWKKKKKKEKKKQTLATPPSTLVMDGEI